MNASDADDFPEQILEALSAFRAERGLDHRHLWKNAAANCRQWPLNPSVIRRALCEVVRFDLQQSWQISATSGDAATIVPGSTATVVGSLLEDYLADLPELRDQNGVPEELVLLEYELRVQAGQLVDPLEYERRFPVEWPMLQARVAQTDALIGNRAAISPLPDTTDDVDAGSTRSFPTFRQPGSSLLAGIFGDYQLLNEIARGGMGVVYKARQTKLNRVVAVKMILAGQLASDEHVRRFYSEAEAAAKLDHPGIVPIYEVGKVGDQHFFSMGYVDGAALSARVANGPMEPRAAATIVKAVAEATAYAHQQGVIHRDLKPQNILLTADGHPKITDFGLAKSVEGDSDLTASGQILGTPSYMPPEQAAGKISQIGPASDVYSLGAVLYCLLTGRPPFQSPNVMETLKQVMSSEPVSPRLLSPVVDRDLETICLKCLEKDPARRLASAQELADELGRYLRGDPIRSRRVGPIARTARWCRRNPLAMALSTAVVVLIGLAWIASTLVKEAERTNKLSKIKERFQQTLDAPELTETYLKLGESILNEMSDYDRASAEQGRERLHAAFVQQIEATIRKSGTKIEQLNRVGPALELAVAFQPERVVELKKVFDQRSRNWLTLFDLVAPFADLSSAFEADQLVVDQGTRLIRPAIARTPAVPAADAGDAPLRSKVQVEGDLRVEAMYEPGWQMQRSLGFRFHMSDGQSYSFVLQRAGNSSQIRPDASTESSKPKSDDDPEAPLQWAMRLLRNGVPLREQFLVLAASAEDGLRLLATRQDDRISLQVNDQPPMFFEDAFALSRSKAFSLELMLPPGAAISRLTATRRLHAAGTNPLDRGDELYSAGQFAEALAQYQEVAFAESATEIIQQARYKQANCLMRLGRNDEAMPILMQLFSEPGEQWPMLSGTLIWVSLIRDKQLDDAEAVYERLATQYPFEKLATIVSDDMRREIVAAYGPKYSSRTARGMSLTPNYVRDAERLWRVQKQLQPSGPEFDRACRELYDAYMLVGDLDRALRLVDEALALPLSGWAPFEHHRVLRLQGRSDQVIRELEPQIYTSDGQIRRGVNTMDLELHLCCLADLKQWGQVDKDIREFRNLLNSMRAGDRYYFEPALRLFEGIMLSKYGDRTAAVVTWRAALQREVQPGFWAYEGTSDYHLLRSLGGALDASDANRFLTKFEGSDSGALGTMLKTVLTPQTLVPALRDMWNSQRGREWVDRFVFRQLPTANEVRIRLFLFSLEYARINAFRGQMTDAQTDAIWEMLELTYKAMATDGTMNMSQLLPLALTWKGNMTLFTWDSIASQLSPALRAHFAYLLAHRFLRLGRPQETMKFLKIVRQDATVDSPLANLAASELELLENGVGLVDLRSQTDQSIQVTAKLEGQPSATVEVVSEAKLQLKPGHWELQVTAPHDRQFGFANPRIEIVAGETVTAEIDSPWNADPRVIPLPGMVRSPAQIPGVRRWQLVSLESPGLANGRWMAARISPDFQTVAIGGLDGHVRLWDVATKRYTKILLGNTTEVLSMAWHPHQPRLIAGGIDGTAHIWNTLTGEREVELRSVPNVIGKAAWSPDGRRLVTAGLWGDHHFRLWGESGGNGLSIEQPQIKGVGWSPDSKFFAILGNDQVIKVWDLEGRPVHTFVSPNAVELTDIAWSPDGQTLATGGREPVIRLWNVRNRVAGPVIPTSEQGIIALAWNHDGTRLATATYDGYVDIHEMPSGQRLHRSEYASTGLSVQWSADSKKLFTTHFDCSLCLWQQDAQRLDKFPVPRFQLAPLQWSPDHRRCVVTQVGNSMSLMDASESKFETLPQSQPEPTTTVWSPDSRWIAVSYHNAHMVSIWNAESRSIQSQAKIEGDPITLLAWNAESTQLAVASPAKAVYLLDLEGHLTTAIAALPFKPRALAWRPNESWLSIGYDPNDAKVMIENRELTTKKVVEIPMGANPPVDLLRWSPTGKHLASTHAHEALLWDGQGRQVATCLGHDSGIHDLCWSPDGQAFITGAWDQSVRLWNLEGGCTATLKGHKQVVERVHWGVDGRLLTSSSDGMTRVWDSQSQKLLETTLFLPEANSITFSNTGEVLRRTPQAHQHIAFVLERPLVGQTVAATEMQTWDQFEQTVGVPLQRPGVGDMPK